MLTTLSFVFDHHLHALCVSI